MLQIVLGNWEYPHIIRLTVKHIEVFPHFITQYLRHRNYAVAFLGFRRGYHIFAFEPLIGLVDRNGFRLEIKVLCGEGKQLALAYSAPIKHLKRIERHRLIHNRFRKFLVFFQSPEQHLLVFLFTHISRPCRWIACQAVIPYCVIKHSAQLGMYGLEVCLRVKFSALVFKTSDRVLPLDNVFRSDLTQLPF